MSYKSDLQQNNTDLQAILADVNALPDAGSGGGGVETCTVKIYNDIAHLNHKLRIVGYSFVDDTGHVSTVFSEYYNNYPTEITLDNVVCGSYIYVEHFGYNYVGGSPTGGLVDLSGTYPFMHFKAPTEAGAVGIFRLEDWD